MKDIKECLKDNRNIILLSDRVEHIKILYNEIKDFNENVYIINGQMKMSEKRKVIEQIKNIKHDGFVILATGKYIGEGFDLPSLNTLFITMPFKWEGMLAQYVGRLHRTMENKTEVVVYDYVDLKIPMFSKMFSKRLRAYKKHNYILNNDLFENDTVLFNKHSYKGKLLEDIRCAQKEILLLVNNFDIFTLSSILLEMDGLNVRIISTLDFSELNIDVSRVVIEKYESTINSIIIDNQFIWYGEINPFKENMYDDSIMRIDDESYVKELVFEVKNQ